MKNLILLHGALGHSDLFNPYLEVLSKHFNVHTLLFSGHGGTHLPENGITIEKYTEELSEFIKERNLDQITIFGHSMGGYVALCYASQNPITLNSVMTLGTKFDWTEEQASRESKMLNPDVILEKVPKYAELLEIQHGMKWKELLPAIAGMMVSLGKNPSLKSENLNKIKIPVQIMVGDQDHMVSIEESLKTSNLIPNSKFMVLPDTKHPFEKVQPELLINSMKDFWGFDSN